jgi:hypothetical protein
MLDNFIKEIETTKTVTSKRKSDSKVSDIDPPKVPLMDENFLRGEDSRKKSRSSSSATISTSSSAAPFGGIGSPRQLTKTPGSSSSATTSTSSSAAPFTSHSTQITSLPQSNHQTFRKGDFSPTMSSK